MGIKGMKTQCQVLLGQCIKNTFDTEMETFNYSFLLERFPVLNSKLSLSAGLPKMIINQSDSI